MPGSAEANSSSKRFARSALIHSPQELRRSKSNLPIGVNYRLTMAARRRSLLKRQLDGEATMSFRIQTGLRDLIHGPDKSPTKESHELGEGWCGVPFLYISSTESLALSLSFSNTII